MWKRFMQYLQISQSNIHTTHLFPLPNASQTCTQTPIHTYYNINDDAPLTLDDIRDFEASYHLYFIEELFPYPPIEPASFLPKLLPLFPTHYHRYISKATNAAYLSPHLSLGEVILREHIIIRLPHSPSASYVEGVHHVNQLNGLSIRTLFGNIPTNYKIVHPANPQISFFSPSPTRDYMIV